MVKLEAIGHLTSTQYTMIQHCHKQASCKSKPTAERKNEIVCQSAARLYAVTNTIFFLIRITLKSNKQILIKGKADQPADVAVSAHPRI